MSVSSSDFVIESELIHSCSFGTRVSHFLPCGSPMPLMTCLLKEVLLMDFCPAGNDHGAPSADSVAKLGYVEREYQQETAVRVSPARRYSPGSTAVLQPV